MTTNNHPAHGPVSLGRLHQIREILSKAAAQSDGGNLGYAMADAVKVIDGVLAGRNAEPVAYMTYKGYLLHAADPKLAAYSDPTPLYDVPPFTAVPDDIDARMKSAGMLSAAEIVAGQPINAFMKHAGVTDLESLLKWAEMRRAEFLRMQAGYELGDKSKDDMYEWVISHVAAFSELHVNIRAAMIQAGNSPVIPDGWVMVPKIPTPEIKSVIRKIGFRCNCRHCQERHWNELLEAAQGAVSA